MRIRLFDVALSLALLSAGVLTAPPRAIAAPDYLDEAQHLEAKGQLRAAEIQLKNAVRSDQSNMTAHYRLAILELRLGEAAAAEHEASVARAGGFDPEKVVPLLADAYLAQHKYKELLQEFPATSGSLVERAGVLVARGYAQLALQRRDDAKKSFQQAEQLAPKMPQPVLAEARLAVGDHDLARAASLYDRVLSLDPKFRDALAGKADVLRLQGNTQAALALLNKAINEAPDFAQARLQRAQILLEQGHEKEAASDVNAVMQAQPRNGGAIYLDALIALRANNLQKADSDLQKISSIIAAIPKGYYVQAIVQYRLHQLDQAADSARRYVARNPDDLPGHKLLGLIELALGHPSETIDTLSKFDTAGKADAGTLDLIGRAYAALGIPSKALASFNQAVKLEPDNAALRMRLGASQLRAGDTEAAIKDLQDSLDISPSAPAGEMLVLTSLAAAHWDDAIAAADKLQKAQPNSPIPGNLQGLIKLARFDLSGAAAAFAAVSQKYPDYVPARLNLAHVQDLQGKPEAAEDTLRQALSRQPGNGVVLTRLVNLLLRDGKSDAAVAAAQKAHDASPDNVGMTAGLIELYLRVGQKEKALELAQRESGANTVGNFPLIAARAQAELATGHKSDGLHTFARLLQIAPSRIDLRLQYARLLAANGDKDGARQAIDAGLKAFPENAQLAEARVAFELQTAGLDAALAKVAALRQSNPNLPNAGLLDGDLYMAAHKYDAAIAAFAKVFEEAPSTGVALRLFHAQVAAGKQDAALTGLRTWFAKNPKDLVAAEVLGSYELTSHNLDQAKKDFELVLAKSPQNVIALNNLAWIEQKAGNLDGARALAERAYLLSPNLSQTADTLGWILVRQGHPADGLGLLRQANAEQKSDASVRYHLAVALNDTGQRDQAIALLAPLVKQGATPFDDKSAAEKLFAELSKK